MTQEKILMRTRRYPEPKIVSILHQNLALYFDRGIFIFLQHSQQWQVF
jgi:hypothetical protein